jgi:hypothetical protein
MEYLEGAESVDKIHKTLPRGMALKQYFELNFGESYSLFYAKAMKNFVRSLVGYSLLTYLVQVSGGVYVSLARRATAWCGAEFAERHRP